MSTSEIKVITHGFRAISNAEVIIDGITVVAGENGSGKSTLSKLLYYLYKTAADYEALVARDLRFRLRPVDRFIEIALSDIRSLSRERNTREEFEELRHLREYSFSVDEVAMTKWTDLIRKIGNNYSSQKSLFEDSYRNPRFGNRLRFIVKDILKDYSVDDENEGIPFEKIAVLTRRLFQEAIDKIKLRPTELLVAELEGLYSEGSLPEVFEVYEFGEQIMSLTKKSLAIPYLVQNAIYIDTPMVLGIDYSDNTYWDDLNELLLKKGKQINTGELTNKIRNEILSGDVALRDNGLSTSDFTFKRDDGSVFQLLECATGVKAFGIIQLLLKNGSINDKTLLIIDEPESHLHPQWIIEYARLVVLLNKEIGVKFFIASHNPDMVSAIKHISAKEQTIDKVNFYLAQRDAGQHKYHYRHLQQNIEPIFESFNIALDRINLYTS
jgi:predicted ATP-dependent endonuclease of OLD family